MSFGGGFAQPKKLPAEKKAGGDVKRNFVVKKSGRKGPVLVKKNEAAIAELTDSLNKQPKFGKMVVYSVGCFDKLAVDETSAEEIIESGAIETFMKVLTLNPENEAIHTAINKVLKNLAKNDRLAALLAQKIGGFYKPFGDSLRNHVEPETLTATASTLARITKAATPETIEQMIKAGIPSALCGAIVRHGGSRELLAASTEALARFGEQPRIAAEILRSGAIERILQGMREHPEDLILAKGGAALIAGICKSGGPEAIDALKRMGAVDCLVAALEAHPYNDELCGYASEALKHLTGTSDMGMALAPIIQGDTRIDHKLAAALSKIAALSLVAENVDYMYREHGVDWLLSVLKNAVAMEGSVASKVLANGTRVLQQAMTDDHKVYDMMRKGAVPVLASILVGHMDDVKAVEGALTALAKMITRKENAIYIANKGGIESAMRCVASHPKSENVARAALDLFDSMALFPETGAMMMQKGAIRSLMDILASHIDNPEICNSTIVTLGKLATSEENVQQMIDQGFLPRLVDVLKRHPEQAEVCKNAMMALDTAILIPGASGKLRKLGALDALSNVTDHHPDDAEVQELASKLHDAISGDDEKRRAEAEAKAKADEDEKMRMVEAERLRAADAEAARLRAVQEEQDRIAAIKREKAEGERKAQMARLEAERARQLEQESLEAEMARALEAMRASEQASRLRAYQEEEAKRQDDERGRLAAEMEAAKAKAAHENKRLEELEKKRKELEKLRLELAKKDDDPPPRQLYSLMGMGPEKAPKPKPEKVKLNKSARDIFDADPEKDRKLAELPIPIKNFLLAGQLLVKHSKTAMPRPRHVYLSQDIEWLIWKDVGKGEIDMKQRMRIYKIYGVNAGRCTEQLQRKRMGKYLAKEDCCFSIYGADVYEEERTVDLEAPSPKEATTWIHALEVLVEYAKNKLMWGQDNVDMISEKSLVKMGHRAGGGDDDDDDVVFQPSAVGPGAGRGGGAAGAKK